MQFMHINYVLQMKLLHTIFFLKNGHCNTHIQFDLLFLQLGLDLPRVALWSLNPCLWLQVITFTSRVKQKWFHRIPWGRSEKHQALSFAHMNVGSWDQSTTLWPASFQMMSSKQCHSICMNFLPVNLRLQASPTDPAWRTEYLSLFKLQICKQFKWL